MFNPPRATFLWLESVHRQDFRFCASPELDGHTARGRLTVFLGTLIIADVPLVIRVDSHTNHDCGQDATETASARPYRKVFASYSHKDLAVVREFEHFAAAFGDRYLRDSMTLRTGEVWNNRIVELIDEADIFQLFWSRRSMNSGFVRQEWEHALSLGRPHFIRPVYWEEPLPKDERAGLPPDSLRRLHFQLLGSSKNSREQIHSSGHAESGDYRHGEIMPNESSLSNVLFSARDSIGKNEWNSYDEGTSNERMSRSRRKVDEQRIEAPWTDLQQPSVAPKERDAAQTIKAVCPLCGACNRESETFTCKVCHTEHLCLEHRAGNQSCMECLNKEEALWKECASRSDSASLESYLHRTVLKRHADKALVLLEKQKRSPRSDFFSQPAHQVPQFEENSPYGTETTRVPGTQFRVHIEGNLHADFCWVPATTSEAWKSLNGGQDVFMMGSPVGEEGSFEDERPRHPVRLTRGFWMAQYLVTQRLWMSVTGSNPSKFNEAGPDAPVESISWEDGQAFIARLNLRIAGGGFRMPTEAEWEFACRAGTTTAVYADALPIPGLNNGQLLDGIAWHGDNSRVAATGGPSSGDRPERQERNPHAAPHPVGMKLPNAWGLYDMIGNVGEWCHDCYTEYREALAVDPCSLESTVARVIRGGNWSSDARECRAGHRSCGRQTLVDPSLGLRLVWQPANAGVISPVV